MNSLPYRLGVGVVLFNSAGLAWVGRRIAKPGENIEDYWQLPQGGVDDGEDPVNAAYRELREETGTDAAEIIAESGHWLTYDLPDHLQGVSWGGRYRGQSQKWFAMRFLGADDDFDLAADGEPEFDAWKWTELETLPDMIVPFKRTVYQDIVAEFADVSRGLRS